MSKDRIFQAPSNDIFRFTTFSCFVKIQPCQLGQVSNTSEALSWVCGFLAALPSKAPCSITTGIQNECATLQ